jgi:hypothetical protein
MLNKTKLKKSFNNLLAHGSFGAIFNYDCKKVVKIVSLCSSFDFSYNKGYRGTLQTLKWINKSKNKNFVRVLDYGTLDRNLKEQLKNHNNYKYIGYDLVDNEKILNNKLHFILMEKLIKLSYYERSLFNECVEDFFSNGKAKVTRSKKYNKLYEFLERINNCGEYQDLHFNNVMKDKKGNYKLVDVESFIPK